MAFILIVEADSALRRVLVSKLQKCHQVIAVADEKEALRCLSERLFALIILRKSSPAVMNFCRSLPRSPSILDLSSPAADFRLKNGEPMNFDDSDAFLEAVRQKLEHHSMGSKSPQLPAVESPIIGKSLAIQRVFRLLDRLAKSDLTILLVGETGVGKELFAQEIHRRSSRAGKPFLAVNGAALPFEMVESELFGHERGAFTDAHRQHRGYFERANSGTLFLDEVGELPFWLQVKLLRVLECHSFERLGGEELLQTDVRFLAATHQNLPSLVARGRFRADLFYRLQGAQIVIPPLRERQEDIPLLINYFLQSESSPCYFNGETLELLQRYPWPGNVRELKNFCQYMALFYPEKKVTPDQLDPRFFCAEPGHFQAKMPPNCRRFDGELWNENVAAEKIADDSLLPIPLLAPENIPLKNDETPADSLQNALRVTGGNRVRAAKLLGISRSTFYRRLHGRNNI